jgi:hypothetical protein
MKVKKMDGKLMEGPILNLRKTKAYNVEKKKKWGVFQNIRKN